MKNSSPFHVMFYFLAPVAYFSEFIILKLFPENHSVNGLLGGLWTIGQVGIMITLFQIYRNKLTGEKWSALGLVIAGIGAICYTINYFFGYWLHINTRVFLPLGALLTGIGMTVTGVQILIAKKWTGGMKVAPLLVGLYPFVIMFPLVVITGHPDLNAILGWGIPWLVLGYAMVENELKRDQVHNNR